MVDLVRKNIHRVAYRNRIEASHSPRGTYAGRAGWSLPCKWQPLFGLTCYRCIQSGTGNHTLPLGLSTPSNTKAQPCNETLPHGHSIFISSILSNTPICHCLGSHRVCDNSDAVETVSIVLDSDRPRTRRRAVNSPCAVFGLSCKISVSQSCWSPWEPPRHSRCPSLRSIPLLLAPSTMQHKTANRAN